MSGFASECAPTQLYHSVLFYCPPLGLTCFARLSPLLHKERRKAPWSRKDRGKREPRDMCMAMYQAATSGAGSGIVSGRLQLTLRFDREKTATRESETRAHPTMTSCTPSSGCGRAVERHLPTSNLSYSYTLPRQLTSYREKHKLTIAKHYQEKVPICMNHPRYLVSVP